MKKTILFLLAAVISCAGYSQFTTKNLLVKGTYNFTLNTKEVQMRITPDCDTLEIVGKKLKYIKIDGKVYEIKRSTELKEVVDNYGFKGILPSTIWYTDTSYYFPGRLTIH
jgi:hypothetical protein